MLVQSEGHLRGGGRVYGGRGGDCPFRIWYLADLVYEQENPSRNGSLLLHTKVKNVLFSKRKNT